MIKKLS